MSVTIKQGDDQVRTATLLLAAAVELDLDPSVVEVRPFKGVFVVPDEVAERVKDDFDFDSDEEKKDPEPKAPAKKATASKRTTAKKAAAKKAATSKKVD